MAEKTTMILTIRRDVTGLGSLDEAQRQRDNWERYFKSQGWEVDAKELYTENS